MNADDTDILNVDQDSLIENNLFAYCYNNPVMLKDDTGYIPVETVVDVASIGFSAYDLITKPSWINAGFLLWDVAATCLPYVPGSYVAKGIKTGTKLVSKADDAVKISVNTSRRTAVKKAWKQETKMVKSTGKGTRDWTKGEAKQLLNNGKVKGYQGHHINSVKGSPLLAGNPNNIRFLTPQEHLFTHGGNWRNPTSGNLLNRLW